MSDVLVSREDGWMPRVVRTQNGLVLQIAGGADSLHQPREFSIPIREEHFAVIRDDLSRHLLLWAALDPLCGGAGIDGPIDQAAAVALLDPILLAPADAVESFLRGIEWNRRLLVAHRADVYQLERGEVFAALSHAEEMSLWRRVRHWEQHRDEIRRKARKHRR